MSPLAHLLRALVHIYRWVISPLLGPRCRFMPSCSEYALDALSKHGAVGGSWLTLKRILRCHPWGGSGWDPVPEPGRRFCAHTTSNGGTGPGPSGPSGGASLS